MLQINAKSLGTVAVLSLEGQVVNGETEILRNIVLSLSETLADVTAVILDLSRVTTVDAGGLGVLLELREQIQSRGIRFELRNVTKQVKRVFEITRLDTVFQITSAVEFFPTVSRDRRTSVGIHGARLASCA